MESLNEFLNTLFEEFISKEKGKNFELHWIIKVSDFFNEKKEKIIEFLKNINFIIESEIRYCPSSAYVWSVKSEFSRSSDDEELEYRDPKAYLLEPEHVCPHGKKYEYACLSHNTCEKCFVNNGDWCHGEYYNQKDFEFAIDDAFSSYSNCYGNDQYAFCEDSYRIVYPIIIIYPCDNEKQFSNFFIDPAYLVNSLGSCEFCNVETFNICKGKFLDDSFDEEIILPIEEPKNE